MPVEKKPPIEPIEEDASPLWTGFLWGFWGRIVLSKPLSWGRRGPGLLSGGGFQDLRT